MKTLTKWLTAVLAVVMLLTLCACGNNGTTGGVANYQVKVLDGQGKPLTTGVIVKFMQGGQQVAMQAVNGEGIAAKELEKGDYTVELVFTNADQGGHYDTSAAVLSAEKTSLELSLINALGDEPQEISVGGETFTAYRVSAGSTAVPVKASVRNYFIFAPTEAGTYDFRVNNAEIILGYYGGTHFVQSQSVVDVIDNVVTLSISASSLGGNYVIGLDGADADAEAILSIIRVGDAVVKLEDLPWTEYKTTHTPTPYTLDLNGKALKYIDIKGKTEDNQVVFNDADGYYHFGTADGPVVLMHLGKDAPYFSLQTIIEGDGLGGGSPIREYFFDGNGTSVENFIKKEDYTDILRTYFENMDPKAGVYPLTKDLEYIIKNGCKQWWDKNDPDYSEFSITDCNPEIGWMFALCYVG